MASWLVEAACGSHTAPTLQVAATMPLRVSTTLARTLARSREATTVISRSEQFFSTTPNLLPATRPMMSLPRRVRERRSPTPMIPSSPASKPKLSLIIASRSMEATRKAQWRDSALALSMAVVSSSRSALRLR
jgi:hypothetical protein